MRHTQSRAFSTSSCQKDHKGCIYAQWLQRSINSEFPVFDSIDSFCHPLDFRRTEVPVQRSAYKGRVISLPVLPKDASFAFLMASQYKYYQEMDTEWCQGAPNRSSYSQDDQHSLVQRMGPARYGFSDRHDGRQASLNETSSSLSSVPPLSSLELSHLSGRRLQDALPHRQKWVDDRGPTFRILLTRPITALRKLMRDQY